MNHPNLPKIAMLTAMWVALACTPDGTSNTHAPGQTSPAAAPADLWAGMEPPATQPQETFSFERNPKPPPKPQVRRKELLGLGEPDKPNHTPTAGDRP
ncbi:MAG: hypothetical protein AAFX99_32405, partial [Myxococcota bacterium]